MVQHTRLETLNNISNPEVQAALDTIIANMLASQDFNAIRDAIADLYDPLYTDMIVYSGAQYNTAVANKAQYVIDNFSEAVKSCVFTLIDDLSVTSP